MGCRGIILAEQTDIDFTRKKWCTQKNNIQNDVLTFQSGSNAEGKNWFGLISVRQNVNE